jgi:hypothetical protein
VRALLRGWAMISALAMALSGCGSAGEPMLSRAHIAAFAARVNLRAADLPGGFLLGDGGESRTERVAGEALVEAAGAPEAQVLRCAGASTGAPPYRVASPVIHVGGELITSTVLALPGATSAAANAARGRLAAIRSTRWPACQERDGEPVERKLSSGVSVTVLADPLRALPATAVRRTRVEVTESRTITLPTETGVQTRRRVTHVIVYTDLVAFLAGRALIELEASSRGAPPAPALERHALALLRKHAGRDGL